MAIYDGWFTEDLLNYLKEGDPLSDYSTSDPREFVGRYCGTTIPEINWLRSDSSLANEVFLSFTSNKIDSKNKGFKLEYSPYGKLYHLNV